MEETEGRDFVLEDNVLDDKLINATPTCQSRDIDPGLDQVKQHY